MEFFFKKNKWHYSMGVICNPFYSTGTAFHRRLQDSEMKYMYFKFATFNDLMASLSLKFGMYYFARLPDVKLLNKWHFIWGESIHIGLELHCLYCFYLARSWLNCQPMILFLNIVSPGMFDEVLTLDSFGAWISAYNLALDRLMGRDLGPRPNKIGD